MVRRGGGPAGARRLTSIMSVKGPQGIMWKRMIVCMETDLRARAQGIITEAKRQSERERRALGTLRKRRVGKAASREINSVHQEKGCDTDSGADTLPPAKEEEHWVQGAGMVGSKSGTRNLSRKEEEGI